MKIRKITLALIVSIMIGYIPTSSFAVNSVPSHGLSVTPSRQALNIAASKEKASYFTVANYTDKVMKVDLTVQEFSVSDLTYDYVFRKPDHEWVKMQLDQIYLQPKQSSKVFYNVTVPPRAKPGGYYFALFASTKVEESGLPGTEQVASLLYLTVDGKLVRTSVLQNDSVPWFVMGNEIPYTFNVKDTGNVYFTAYFYGKVNGLFSNQPMTGTSHVLMPDAIRTISGSVPTPILPGVYSLTYGYKVDFADVEIAKTKLVVFIPPWSIATLAFIILAVIWLRQRSRIQKEPQ